MPRICYVERNFASSSLQLIEQANAIMAEYEAQGFDLTLRQLYYQFVARDTFPDDRTWRWTGSKWVRDENGTKNATPNYKWLGSIVNDARLAGLIDWDTIVDRTRKLESEPHWKNPSVIVEACADHFRVDMWKTQTYRPEVWIEKDALTGVISGVCEEYDVPYFSCRGYTSQSEMWSAARRLNTYARKRQRAHIIHLGDHDPSGIDMTRDIIDRLGLFMKHHGCRPATVSRIALNMDQVEQYGPPPNPAKLSDSRARDYVEKWGSDSWELDALEPTVLSELVKEAILDCRDEEPWQEKEAEQETGRKMLRFVSERWEEITDEFEEDDEDES